MRAEEIDLPVRMLRALPGFAGIYHYRLKSVPGNPWFYWLDSEEGPGFLLTKPHLFFKGYKAAVKKEDLAELLSGDKEPEVYVILTVPGDAMSMTANLLAPLVIDLDRGLGLQLVLHDSAYTTRHKLFSPEQRRRCG